MSATLLLALALSLQATVPPSAGGPCALATGLREALQTRFGTSRVLNASDLFEDERALFKADHPGACPGVASGRFFGDKERPALALVLLNGGPKANVRLVVARPALSAWTFHELDEIATGSTAVALRGGPGKFVDSRDPARTRRTDADVVRLLSLETWERVYLWTGRTFEAFHVSP